MTTLQSYIAGRWIGKESAQQLRSAINGQAVAATHAEAIDFAEALQYARRTGIPALMKLDFQQRAERLKALAKYLAANKETLYAISAHTGATRADSWIDIEGGAGTLSAYAGIGSNELPSGNLVHEGPAFPLGKKGGFAGTHILVPRGGVAVHINAFNFPVWGLLEKFAPSFLAGMPCIGKPASATSYLTEAAVRLIVQSGILPEGSLQLVIGGTGDLLDRLEGPDVVTFTGSADTAAKLRVHPNIVRQSIPFNAEADSLNCAILAPDVTPDDEEFDLFVKEVAREMTTKAGQKCTAIRRAIVPRQHLDAVAERLRARLAKTVIGDPSREEVRMGALASHAQQADVAERVATLLQGAELVYGERDGFSPVGDGVSEGAFFAPTLLLSRKPLEHDAAHDIEAFGPVSTLMPYDGIDEALALAARGRGSLVGTLVTRDPAIAAKAIPVAAAWHGRLLVLDREAAAESTGHGSPLPQLKHGGPGRAGGGEELGGLRAVKHYLQRAAVQGSPTMLAAITGEHVRGAAVRERARCIRSAATSKTCASATRCSPTAAPSARPTSWPSAASRATISTCTSTKSRRRNRRSASASRTATSCCRRRRACSSRPRRARCSPTTAWTRCASSSPWASATPSAHASPASARSTATRRTRAARARAWWHGMWR
ncbi:oxepin-CoA hydrolase/3-oxo-5,6-dehydrosuberyl-CoA semialdehyde dehydrogenase [Variovorax sp. W2I14]